MSLSNGTHYLSYFSEVFANESDRHIVQCPIDHSFQALECIVTVLSDVVLHVPSSVPSDLIHNGILEFYFLEYKCIFPLWSFHTYNLASLPIHDAYQQLSCHVYMHSQNAPHALRNSIGVNKLVNFIIVCGVSHGWLTTSCDL